MEASLQRKLAAKKNSQVTYKKVQAEAPASTANLGPGFDVFGLALDLFHDIVEIELLPKRGITLDIHGADESISREPKKNTAGLAATIILDAMKRNEGLRIDLKKGVPVGKGLGSSASSAVACVLALNRMFSLELAVEDMVALAGQGEIASAATAHFDNVAAATLGGFVIVSHEPMPIPLKPPLDLEVAVAIPNIELPKKKTKAMRDILPQRVPLRDVTGNIFHAALFISGILQSDIAMMGEAMKDLIVEPVRSKSIPMFQAVKSAAIEAGASGVAISGAGPALVALCDKTVTNTKDVAKVMSDAFQEGGIACEHYATKPSNGARILKEM
jgi:homoserine kinase